MPSRFSLNCPSVTVLAGLADGTLEPAMRAAVESHVADCDPCVERLGALVRLARTHPPEVPAELRARVELPALVPESPPARSSRPALALAAAACLSLGGWFLVHQFSPGTPIPPSVQDDVVRGAGTHGGTPVVRRPGAGERLAGGPVRIEWQPADSAIAYTVRVVRDDGGLLWEHQAGGTTTIVPESVALPTEVPLYLSLTALLPDGRTSRAPSVRFEIAQE